MHITTKNENTRKALEEHEKWLLKQKRELYEQATEKEDNIASGRHRVLNSLLLPFTGDKIRENNRRLRKVQNMLEEVNRK